MAGAVSMIRQKKEHEKMMKSAKTGAVLLAVAAVVATVLMLLSVHQARAAEMPAETVQETPKVTVIPARPSTEPTPPPTVNSIRLFAFGTELTGDGFTAYVGDKFTISAEIDPQLTRPPVDWSVSDSESARLTVSDDRLSCEFSALKPSGKIELTVSCYGAETVLPVYLWKR